MALIVPVESTEDQHPNALMSGMSEIHETSEMSDMSEPKRLKIAQESDDHLEESSEMSNGCPKEPKVMLDSDPKECDDAPKDVSKEPEQIIGCDLKESAEHQETTNSVLSESEKMVDCEPERKEEPLNFVQNKPEETLDSVLTELDKTFKCVPIEPGEVLNSVSSEPEKMLDHNPKETERASTCILNEPKEVATCVLNEPEAVPNCGRSKFKEAHDCSDFRNSFCFVCGQFVEEINKRYTITSSIMNTFVYCFSKDIIQTSHRPGKRFGSFTSPTL